MTINSLQLLNKRVSPFTVSLAAAQTPVGDAIESIGRALDPRGQPANYTQAAIFGVRKNALKAMVNTYVLARPLTALVGTGRGSDDTKLRCGIITQKMIEVHANHMGCSTAAADLLSCALFVWWPIREVARACVLAVAVVVGIAAGLIGAPRGVINFRSTSHKSPDIYTAWHELKNSLEKKGVGHGGNPLNRCERKRFAAMLAHTCEMNLGRRLRADERGGVLKYAEDYFRFSDIK